VRSALAAARALNASIRQQGVAYDGASGALRALQWRQTALLSEAVLTALAFFVEHGGGSRGARALCAPDGDRTPMARIGPLADFRFASERPEGRGEQIHVRLKGESFACAARPVRRRDRDDQPFFERDWPGFLTGAIHHFVD
jgi:succinate dehydrogenase / fumarate reductase flavoprotein subunit